MKRRVVVACLTALVASSSWLATVQPAAADPVAAPNPLVVVFDMSGSMNDDDGSGTIKLQAAKDALNDLIDAQVRAGSVRQLGIWKYPGGATTDGCAAGSWVPGAEVKLHSNPTTLSAAVSTMSSDGNTPTGPALQAVADDLRGRSGQNRATLVLVSDGLSNCGTPPCEVAQSLVDDGFDVTVNPVGFQIDPDGREELECIAAATRGTYTDAADKEKLGEIIKQYGTPEVGLQVSMESTSVSPGVPAVITATVSNASAVQLTDVKLSVAPIDDVSRRLFPQIVPPRLSLGNIPPGGCPGLCTRTWSLPVGDLLGDQEVARLRVVASAEAAISASQELQVTVTKEGTAGTWLADALDSGSFVILGDSYSSGEGAGSYLDNLDGSADKCHRSVRTYIYDEYGNAADDTILACSGAVVTNVWGGIGQNGERVQLDQFDDLDSAPDVVFLTLGGNDMEFATIVTECVVFDCSGPLWDSGWEDITTRRLPALRLLLPGVYGRILDAVHAKDPARPTQVVVLPYPQVLGTRWLGACGDFEPQEFALAVDLIRRIDFVIQDTVSELRGKGYTNLHYAKGVLRLFSPDDSACSAQPHVNPASGADFIARAISPQHTATEMMHPNALGHSDITEALKAWAKTEPAGTSASTNQRWAAGSLDSLPTATIALDGGAAAVRVQTGTTVTVTGGGFLPGTPVSATLASVQRVLGTAVADENGRVSIDVGIPASTEPGPHTLGLAGMNHDGPLTLSRPAVAAAPAPAWLLPVLGASAFCLLAALTLFIFGLRGRLSPSERPGNGPRTPPGTKQDGARP